MAEAHLVQQWRSYPIPKWRRPCWSKSEGDTSSKATEAPLVRKRGRLPAESRASPSGAKAAKAPGPKRRAPPPPSPEALQAPVVRKRRRLAGQSGWGPGAPKAAEAPVVGQRQRPHAKVAEAPVVPKWPRPCP